MSCQDFQFAGHMSGHDNFLSWALKTLQRTRKPLSSPPNPSVGYAGLSPSKPTCSPDVMSQHWSLQQIATWVRRIYTYVKADNSESNQQPDMKDLVSHKVIAINPSRYDHFQYFEWMCCFFQITIVGLTTSIIIIFSLRTTITITTRVSVVPKFLTQT